MIDKEKNRMGAKTKSSAKFVSSLFSRSSQKLLSPKPTVHYSKNLKPSIKLYAKFIDPVKDCKACKVKIAEKQCSDTEDANLRLVEIVTQSYEWFKKRPFMQVLQRYKAEKLQILEKHKGEVEQLQRKIENLQEENAGFEEEIQKIVEKEESLRVTPEKVLEKLQKFSNFGKRTELTEAICAEFCNFKVAKSWTGVQRVNAQIVELFSMDELQESYNDIISTFCSRIVVEMGRTQASKEKASKVYSQKGDVAKVFETFKAFETGISMSSVYN